ncbi:MAG: metal-dependent transcriptional regulator [Planctomycetota bacterium]|nr:metal-dependent transcriptional regulator [Planctomycetota bacterium]
MATETVENYLKAIYSLCEESTGGEATMTRLAAALGVTTGTATSMVKKLNTGRLAKYHRYGGVTLTAKGRRAALDVLRRHRLIESFLVDTLHLDWADVHDEAERLEHAVSSRLLDAIDAFLGHPQFDPHGDPIPDRSGQIRSSGFQPLDTFSTGSSPVVTRITDQDKAFLSFVATHGLRPGATLRVIEYDAIAQSMRVESPGFGPVWLSFAVAAKIGAQTLAGSPQSETTLKRRQPPPK